MGVLLKAWSPPLAALLVVLSVIYTGMTMRTHTESIQRRLTTVEKHMDAIRNALEGHQGVIVRIATLDVRMGEKLQNLIAQRDNYLEQSGQEWFNIQAIRDAFQAMNAPRSKLRGIKTPNPKTLKTAPSGRLDDEASYMSFRCLAS